MLMSNEITPRPVRSLVVTGTVTTELRMPVTPAGIETLTDAGFKIPGSTSSQLFSTRLPDHVPAKRFMDEKMIVNIKTTDAGINENALKGAVLVSIGKLDDCTICDLNCDIQPPKDQEKQRKVDGVSGPRPSLIGKELVLCDEVNSYGTIHEADRLNCKT